VDRQSIQRVIYGAPRLRRTRPRHARWHEGGLLSLTAKNVSFSYSGRDRDLVLEEVTLEAERGGLVALLGPNGSGKTSLLRLLSGIMAPLSGTITLDGASIGEWSRRDIARRIAVVPQETHALFD